jgi:hypothetical protein
METPREKVVKTALAEVGTTEEGGNNRGKRVGEYLASTGLGQGHPWCAAYTKWCFAQNKLDTPGATAWSPSWFPNSKTHWKKGNEATGIRPADVFGIHYSNLGRIGHAGFIEYEKDGWIYTIEGNTGNDQGRDGDVVKRSKRSLKTVSKISNWID